MSTLRTFAETVRRFLPEISPPGVPPNIKQRLIWVGIALTLYFIMYNTIAFGVYQPKSQGVDFIQVVTASRNGSLITLGIGPIVIASIILQLLNGAGMIHLDMHNMDDRRTFATVQKFLTILIAVFQASMYVFLGKITVLPVLGSLFLTQVVVILQLIAGSVIVLLLDEIVSKYGIGSGVSLFIAANVSFTVVYGTVDLLIGDGGVMSTLATGGAFALSDMIIQLMPLFSTIIVFAVVAYAEGMKIEIPLSFGMARGVGGRLPIKFLYVSNIPVILTSALMVYIQLMALFLPAHAPTETPQGVDVLGMIGWVQQTETGPRLVDGFLYLLTYIGKPYKVNIFEYYASLFQQVTPIYHIPQILHVIVYAIVFVLFSVIFGMFWVETASMGPKDVAQQLMASGLHRPGFRRDPRILERLLSRYIPVITILGSAFVGLLAVFADLTGALGTGTGILLTVSILHRFYEELKRMNVFSLYPSVGKYF
ncbi:preprotein translocase subunit SecY [Candidatus Micrarchaeota archaeon]|nr:preprotein translocase subunit SecY [Candidatus Micrarchaeota archaeon]